MLASQAPLGTITPMCADKEGGEERVQRGARGLVLPGLIVTALAVLLVLVIFVHPFREPSSSAPTRDSLVEVSSTDSTATMPGLGSEAAPTQPALESEPSATPAPTLTPSPTLTTLPATADPAPTTGVPPSPTATAAPVTPSPSPTAAHHQNWSLVGRMEQGTYASQVTGRQESYLVYLPPGYDEQDRRYPVLYLLHGWPYDETHWDILGVDEVADTGIVEGSLSPFMIVLPGADKDGLYVTTSGGAGSFEEQLVNELMPHIDATFRSVQTREARAIGGISRGGVWSLEIAFRHPDAFGIVGAHSPALSANRAPSAFDPFTLMREPGVAGLRIYLSAGDMDWARQETMELHQALQDQGIASQLAIHEGAHRDQLWAQHLLDYLTFYAAGW